MHLYNFMILGLGLTTGAFAAGCDISDARGGYYRYTVTGMGSDQGDRKCIVSLSQSMTL